MLSDDIMRRYGIAYKPRPTLQHLYPEPQPLTGRGAPKVAVHAKPSGER